MSTTRATKRPPAKPAPKKVRQTPLSNQRAAPEKNTKLEKNRKEKWIPPRAGMGRPKGALNAVTKTAREIFSAFVEGNALKLQELFDRVAKKNPAEALRIYAKLAEFVIPKLQRTELSGEVTNKVITQPAWEDVSPEEASRMYQEMIQAGKKGVTIEHLPSVKPYVAPPKPEVVAAPLPRPRQEFIPAAEPPRRPENVIVLEYTCSLPEHQPVVDSKCAFCRQLWAKQQEAAQDEALRAQRPPQVIT